MNLELNGHLEPKQTKRPPQGNLVTWLSLGFLLLCSCVFISYFMRLVDNVQGDLAQQSAQQSTEAVSDETGYAPFAKQERNERIRDQALMDEEQWREEAANRREREAFETIPSEAYVNQYASQLASTIRKIGEKQKGLRQGMEEELQRVNQGNH
ncbi:MAG: hypothetical protein AAF394_06850 [Planctomycetota bacterium]